MDSKSKDLVPLSVAVSYIIFSLYFRDLLNFDEVTFVTSYLDPDVRHSAMDETLFLSMSDVAAASLGRLRMRTGITHTIPFIKICL